MGNNSRKSYKRNRDYVNTGTRILTAEDVKERLGIGINKARALMKCKDFPSIKLGGCLRVSEKAFEEWIDNSAGMTFNV